MFDSSSAPFLERRLSAIAMSAMDKRLLSLDSAACLHLLSKTAGDIERIRDRVPASYQEMLFGVATLEAELARYAQHCPRHERRSLKLNRSLGMRSLYLAAHALDVEFETDSAGLDLVIDRRRAMFLIGDLADASKLWAEVAVCFENPAATLQHVRSVREAWPE